MSDPSVVLHRHLEGEYITDDGYRVRPYHDHLNRGGQARKRSAWVVYYGPFLTLDEDCRTLADARAAIRLDREGRAARKERQP